MFKVSADRDPISSTNYSNGWTTGIAYRLTRLMTVCTTTDYDATTSTTDNDTVAFVSSQRYINTGTSTSTNSSADCSTRARWSTCIASRVARFVTMIVARLMSVCTTTD